MMGRLSLSSFVAIAISITICVDASAVGNDHECIVRIIDAAPSPLCWQAFDDEIVDSPEIFGARYREMFWRMRIAGETEKFPVRLSVLSREQFVMSILPPSWLKKGLSTKKCVPRGDSEDEDTYVNKCPEHNTCDPDTNTCMGLSQIFTRNSPNTVVFAASEYRKQIGADTMGPVFDIVKKSDHKPSILTKHSDTILGYRLPDYYKLSQPLDFLLGRNDKEDWCKGQKYCDSGDMLDKEPTELHLKQEQVEAFGSCLEYFSDDFQFTVRVAKAFSQGIAPHNVLYRMKDPDTGKYGPLQYGAPVSTEIRGCEYIVKNAVDGSAIKVDVANTVGQNPFL